MPGTPIPFIKASWYDNNGAPAASHKLFSYVTGTTTKADTYTTADLSVANANPIVLDSGGRASVFLPAATFKFVLAPPTDTDPPTSPLWTVDGVAAAPSFDVDLDVAGTAGEALTTNDAVYLSAGDGSRTAGRWYKADADLVYASTDADALGIVPSSIASGASGTIRMAGRLTGLAGLVTGSVYYISATAGAITDSAPTNARAIAVADSATSVILSQWLAQPIATETLSGIVSTTTQTFGGAKTFAGAITGSSTLAVTGTGTFSSTVTTRPAGSAAAVGVGGVFFVDVTQREVVASSTDLVLTNTTIPAGMLPANGDCIYIEMGGVTADTGTTGRTLELLVGATQIGIAAWASTGGTWWGRALIVRLTSTTAAVMGDGRSDGSASSTAMVLVSGLDFTGAITLQTLGTTAAANTFFQDFFIARVWP